MPDRQWLQLERFDYSPLAGRWSVVRMVARLEGEPSPPASATLMIQRGSLTSSHGAFVSAVDRRVTPAGSELLWIASFAVPLEIVEHPEAEFALSAAGYSVVALPAAGTLAPQTGEELELAGRRWRPVHARRRVTAFATAFAVSTASIPASGLAASWSVPHNIVKPLIHGSDSATGATSTAPGKPGIKLPPPLANGKPRIKLAPPLASGKQQITLATPQISQLESHPRLPLKDSGTKPRPAAAAWSTQGPDSTTTGDPAVAQTPPPTQQPAPTQTPPPTQQPAPTQPAGKTWSTATPADGAQADKHIIAVPHAPHRGTPAGGHRGTPTGGHRGTPTGGAGVSPPLSTPEQLQPVPASVRPAPKTDPTPAGTETSTVPAGTETGMASGTGTAFSAGGGTTGELSTTPPASLLSRLFADVNGPPPFLISIYKRAGQRYDIPWPVLAAINSIETNYGRDLSVSSAGAVGWMQFMPATWSRYGVDANHDGRANPYDPTDAIFSAARYLAANGAPRDLRQAIFAYNHATWYVDEVLLRARWIAANTTLQVKGMPGRKLAAMTAMAELLVGRPYVWGGGHAGWEVVAGYDCSGFVSAVLHAAGYLATPQTTNTLPTQPGILAGPGRYVTIFDRTAPGTQGHVIIDLNGTFYESGGSVSAGGGAGVKKIDQPPFDYLLSFDTIIHPAGM